MASRLEDFTSPKMPGEDEPPLRPLVADPPGKALALLRKGEWSVGNGQCPECYGSGPSFHGRCFGGWQAAAELGHEKKCGRAEAMEELGGEVRRRTQWIT